jgi:long-chain acyl-CoA synthetase
MIQEVPQPWLSAYPQGVPARIDACAYESLPALLDAAFERHGSRSAYACRGEVMGFAELERQTRAIACHLQGLGLGPGARVGLMLPTGISFPVVLLGIVRSGFTAVCINPQYTAPELAHVLEDAQLELLFLPQGLADRLAGAGSAHAPRHLVWVGGDEPPAGPGPSCASLGEVIRQGMARPRALPRMRANDLALLQYTGGTTGVSRGAQLSHGNLVANILQAQAWITPALRALEDGQQHCFACLLPLHHIFGLTACLLLGAHMGALTLLVANPFDVRGAVSQLAAHRVDMLPAVNTLFAAMLADPRLPGLDFSALRVCIAGGMKLQPSVAQRWQAVTGCALVEAYGLSETSPLVCCNPLDGSAQSGSIGLPVPGTDVAILGERGRLGPGEVGEIGVRGPQVMDGYWGDATATRSAFDAEGFFLTGDVGTMDGQGFVRVLERKKDVVIVGGFNVYPSEVETVALAHEAVAECACVGVADVNAGQAVRLFVVCQPGATLTASQLLAHCRRSLTGYKLPRQIVFLEALPRTSVGKVSRPLLREWAAKEAA